MKVPWLFRWIHTHRHTHTHNIKWNWLWAFANCGSSRKQLNPWLPAPSPPWGILALASQAVPGFGGNSGRTAAMEAPTVLASFLLWLLLSAQLGSPVSGAPLCRTGRRLFLSPSAHGGRKASPSVFPSMFPFVTHDLLHQPFRGSAWKWHPCPTPLPKTCWARNLMFLRCDGVRPPQLWRNKRQQLKCSQLNKAEHDQWVSVNVLSGNRELGHHTEEWSHSLGDPRHHPQGSLSARVEKSQHTHFSPRARILSAIPAVSLLYATLYYIYVNIIYTVWVSEWVSESHSVVSNSLWPHELVHGIL